MRFLRSSVLGLCALLLVANSAIATPDADDLSFLDGMALIVMEDGDIPKMHEVRLAVSSLGGHVAIMTPPHTMMAWLSPESSEELLRLDAVRDVYFTPVLDDELPFSDEQSRAMVRYFNDVVTGKIQDKYRPEQSTRTAAAHEHTPDVYEAPELEYPEYLENLRGLGLDMDMMRARGLVSAPGEAMRRNSDYMTGVSSVSVFFVESDGSQTDPDLYTWTEEDMQSYLDGVATGLAWWASRASTFSGCSVTWLIYWYSANDPRCHQWVEPILHDATGPGIDQGEWINEIMTNFGYHSGSYFSKVTSFNTWQRSTYQVDRSYSAFIVYNPPPAPAAFPDGATAYAYFYGPFTVLLFNLSGSTAAEVFAHETGHIFGACDEYAGGCSHCGVCANGINNGNCEACNANSRPCMMRENVYNLCGFTPGQVGWDGVQVTCTPPPPAPLPTPTASSSLPAGHLQGISGSLVISGTNFFAGAKVNLGDGVFVDLVTVDSSTQLTVDFTVLNAAALGLRDVIVTNRDFQSVTLVGAFEVLPTRQHYYSPIGNNVFPYVTPADAATSLQDAVNAAFGGDTLFVATGTFNNFDLSLEKGVLLHGAWANDFSSRDLVSGKTVLDLDDNVTIRPGANGAGLDGFHLINGNGTLETAPFSSPFAYYGGGVRILDATATIANCIIEDGAASSITTFGVGGGIYAQNSDVTITNTTVQNNTATYGGAMYLLNCSGTISGNTIDGNVTQTTNVPGEGAGVFLEGCSGLNFSGNTFSGHTTGSEGAAMLIKNSPAVTFDGDMFAGNVTSFNGGAISADNSGLTLSGVTFNGNTSALGGGIYLENGSNATIAEGVFDSNTGVVGGGLYASGVTVNVEHNLFVGNNGSGGGAALLVTGLVGGQVIGNTFDGNVSSSSGSAVSLGDAAIPVFNNIVANTTGDGFDCSAANASLSYNLVWNSSELDYGGCASGAGSVLADPLFVNAPGGDYHLAVNSPAIDAGTPGQNDPDGSRGDLGIYGSHAFAMDQPAAPIGLMADNVSGDLVLTWTANTEPDVVQYAVYCDTTSGFKPSAANFVAFVASADTASNLGAAPADSTFYKVSAVDTDGYASGYSNEASPSIATSVGGPHVVNNRLFQNVPNPFNPTTTIRFELKAPGNVQLRVYDVSGRLVRTLVNGYQPSGVADVTWTGTDDRGASVASGIYFYRLDAPGFKQTRKMVLLK